MTRVSIADPRKILILRPSALGDVCRTVPLAVSLKRAFPSAELHWLVQRGFEDAVSAHPAVDAVIPFPRTEATLANLINKPRARGQLAEMLRRLRPEHRFDIAIDAQGLLRSGLFTRFTGARVRIGERHAREGAHLAYTHRVRIDPQTHAVDRMLALLDPLNITPIDDIKLHTPAHARHTAEPLLPEEPYAVVAPTARWEGKRWPIERFISITRHLTDERNLRVAVVASNTERTQCAPLLNAFAGDHRVADLVGRTTVGQLMAIIEHAAIVIANDSAALHIAAGFDRPLIGLFGTTRPSRVGPYRRDQDTIQAINPPNGVTHKDRDAGAQLMRSITVPSVVQAAHLRIESLNQNPVPNDAHNPSTPTA